MQMDGAGRTFAGGSTQTRFILLVPDGVARVEFYFPAESIPAGGPTYHRSLGANGTVIRRIGTTSSPPSPPQPAPETPRSRAAERNPATPNRVTVIPATGGPASVFKVKFRLLLNDADYQVRGTGPGEAGCQSTFGDITGGGADDIRGQMFSDTSRLQPGRRWCSGRYRVTVAAYDRGRAGGLGPRAPAPFGTARFTAHR